LLRQTRKYYTQVIQLSCLVASNKIHQTKELQFDHLMN